MCSILVYKSWLVLGLMLCCQSMKWTAGYLTTKPNQQQQTKEPKESETRKFQPLERHISSQDSDLGESVDISGTIDWTGVTVWLQSIEIYTAHNKTREWAGEVRRFHAGVHVLVLHERRFSLMQHDFFLTWQPSAHRMLFRMVESVQDGRILLFLGAPDFTSWLQGEGLSALAKLGSLLGLEAALGEAWVFLARKGSPPLYETLITSRNYTTKDVSPLRFSLTIPRFEERRCPWHQDPALATKAAFCETYEGYKDLCHCQEPLHLHPQMAPVMDLEEVIPVALVTARRFPMVARQVQQIWQSPGGGQTPLAVLVDGYDLQAQMLAQVLNITVTFHDNPVPRGTKQRVNEHIKFSLRTIFKLYPEADKAIVLEDDLSLSPDFISYFQQTSLLMSLDQTVMCVNAYNYNAFPHTASDPSRIYRVQSYPYYGWMTSRAHAQRMLSNWAPLDTNADWDLYSHQYHVDEMHQVIIPEVPRTKHEGGGGVHVTGLDQETTYDRRPVNTLRDVTLKMRRHWRLAYELDRMVTIKQASVVNVTKHPCDEAPVPKYQKNTTHVIYMSLSGGNETENSYTVLGKCMGFYYKNQFENYYSTFSFKFYETPVILVSCWSSAYCDQVPESAIYQPTKSAIEYAKRHLWRHSNSTAEMRWRIPSKRPEDEYYLINIEGIEIELKE